MQTHPGTQMPPGGGHIVRATETGKSVCCQILAPSKFDKTGALSVVISPLGALTAGQVQGMERAGISAAATVNSMLSMPERQDALAVRSLLGGNCRRGEGRHLRRRSMRQPTAQIIIDHNYYMP